MLFDISRPCAKVIRSPMGGGWIVPLTDEGEDILERFFGGPPDPIAPLGGELAYIVEPQEGADLAEYLADAGHTWTVE